MKHPATMNKMVDVSVFEHCCKHFEVNKIKRVFNGLVFNHSLHSSFSVNLLAVNECVCVECVRERALVCERRVHSLPIH